jgi:hypothetical protein
MASGGGGYWVYMGTGDGATAGRSASTEVVLAADVAIGSLPVDRRRSASADKNFLDDFPLARTS